MSALTAPPTYADLERLLAEKERENLGLRKRVHQLDCHNQHFERCESQWCHQTPERPSPALEFAKDTTILNQDLDTWQTRLAESEAQLTASRQEMERLYAGEIDC